MILNLKFLVHNKEEDPVKGGNKANHIIPAMLVTKEQTKSYYLYYSG